MPDGLLMRGGNQPWNDGVILSWQAGFYSNMVKSHDIDQSFLTWVSLEDPDVPFLRAVEDASAPS